MKKSTVYNKIGIPGVYIKFFLFILICPFIYILEIIHSTMMDVTLHLKLTKFLPLLGHILTSLKVLFVLYCLRILLLTALALFSF